MKITRWDSVKSERLKKTRGVSFEEISGAKLVDIKDHPSRKNQKLMLFDYKGYIWLVPFVQTNEEIFLKTLYPSSKYTKIFRKGGLKHENY